MTLRFEAVAWPDDAPAVVEFLTTNEWPFHGQPRPSAEEAADVEMTSDDVASFWIVDDDVAVGLIRLLDLTDVDDGSPSFDLRIAAGHRTRGIGGRALSWLTDHLFGTYPACQRIEATTRADNLAMQAALVRCGYRLEGRFVEAWVNADRTRHDALTYAILRRERVPRGDAFVR